jgi:ATP/maltotriose-dependent transcriptional regulator MalT
MDARTARLALEPIVNLARLHIRTGDGDTAFYLIDTLCQAITDRVDTVIDGIAVPAATLTDTDDQHRDMRQWLWTVHLADGTRALTSTGRWPDAEAHLRRRNDIGHRMFDGRQVWVRGRGGAPVGAAPPLVAEHQYFHVFGSVIAGELGQHL